MNLDLEPTSLPSWEAIAKKLTFKMEIVALIKTRSRLSNIEPSESAY
jgi:hypothetical protein